ncbi:hypothetical protein SAMN05216297_112183 [Flavobacterium phragmitis]|uniref:Uncharacterized protein n=1 Tax=Flavobacterium phragmitis TaxID=739143 RepID=A0A1I1VIG3_9FLAO|nr:hypothetical protein SAMN05216297_112183 [Flavobacterium phragmitis]
MRQIRYRENANLIFIELRIRLNPRLYEVNPRHPRTNLNNKIKKT